MEKAIGFLRKAYDGSVQKGDDYRALQSLMGVELLEWVLGEEAKFAEVLSQWEKIDRARRQ